jgi:hypothetical protein
LKLFAFEVWHTLCQQSLFLHYPTRGNPAEAEKPKLRRGAGEEKVKVCAVEIEKKQERSERKIAS